MSRVVIKVCGITETRDALECAHLGVDAVGFNFWRESPRFIEPEKARRIVERLPVLMAKVGVFVDEAPKRILEIARQVGLTAAQLHGQEAPKVATALAAFPWYKALRVAPGFDPEILARYPCTTFLLDGYDPDRPGGTGSSFEWRIARPLGLRGKILIAGGLTPTIVGVAIDEARPYGVDVCTGVEFVPGKKDLDRLEQFVAAVRRAERRIEAERPA
jgi:phosphoribosylanthranilate isomerase